MKFQFYCKRFLVCDHYAIHNAQMTSSSNQKMKEFNYKNALHLPVRDS